MAPTPSLRLHAVTVADSHASHVSTVGSGATGAAAGAAGGNESRATLIPFRELCAVVSEQASFTLDETAPSEIVRHRAIVDEVFRRAAVLPAPVGAVFRNPDVLTRWMELHYVSLTGALEFVEDRVAARVHIARANGSEDEREAGADIAAAAAESFRALRRRAVAAVPLRLEQVTGLVLSAAFLIERDVWKEFQRAVHELHEGYDFLRFDVTGPWAPYDFVRMQFGG